MRLLVCGGRDYTDRLRVWRTLDAMHARDRIVVLIHGNAEGVDTLAKRWAVARRVWHLPFEPNWQTHGDLAGPIRNRRMLDQGKPDLVLAFPGGRGTRNMIGQAKRAGVPVEIVGARTSRAEMQEG
jgi:hypothetical protein